MNKQAELQKRAVLYVACRGLLRVKQATGSGSSTDTTDDDAAEAPRQYTVTDAAGQAGNTLERSIFGSESGIGQQAGQYLSQFGRHLYGSAVNAMAHSKWKPMRYFGKFLGRNDEKIRQLAALGARAGADYYNKYTDQQIYNNAAAQVEKAKAEAAANQPQSVSFDPDQMFTGLFQGFANMAGARTGQNFGYQQPQYGGYPQQQYQQPQPSYY